jgi:Holliday junction resolvase
MSNTVNYAKEITDLLDRAIHIIPLNTIDHQWALDNYHKSKFNRHYKNEFAQISERQLSLIAESQLSLKNARPIALFYYWYNFLFPLYTLTIWFHIDQKDLGSFRTFLFFDSKELDLFLVRKTRVIMLRKERIELALELDFPSVDDKIWELQNKDRPVESVKDEIAAKAYVESCLNKQPNGRQKLEFGWAKRLNSEVATAINSYHHPRHAEKIKMERELLKASSSMYISDDINIAANNYHAYVGLFIKEKVNPTQSVMNLQTKLSNTPMHLNFIKRILDCAWFSSPGTYRGQVLDSIDLEGNINLIKLDPQRLGHCVNHYWDRISFELPYYHDQLLGSDSCGLDIDNFVEKAPLYQGDIQEGESFVNDILAEATSLKQWTIPFGAYLQIDLDVIKAVKLFEIGQDVACILVDETGHYLLIWVNPLLQKITISNSLNIANSCLKRTNLEISKITDELQEQRSQIKIEKNEQDKNWEEIQQRLYLVIKIILASIIRDFWVVEERERVFGKSFYTKKYTRLKSDWKKKTIVYLPRIRYVGDIKEGSKNLDLVARKPHFVTGHLRKALKTGESQLFLARQYGIVVPEGFTFVRPHKRGEKAQEAIYRSRSALQCIQSLKTSTSEGGRDAWFQYELNVKKWLASNGFEVEHLAANKNGDGGVDIQAHRKKEHLLIQCKYWQSKIGPNVVREMIGTLQTFPKGSHGVIITSSELTEGAKNLSISNSIQYIERVDFSKVLSKHNI